MVKQVIIVRADVGIGKGKIAAQVSHASLGAYKKAKKLTPKTVAAWEAEGEKKVILKASLKEIMEFRQWADEKGLTSYLVKDAGHTQVDPGTVTALAIGPHKDSEFEATERLKLL